VPRKIVKAWRTSHLNLKVEKSDPLSFCKPRKEGVVTRMGAQATKHMKPYMHGTWTFPRAVPTSTTGKLEDELFLMRGEL